jgi:hypothetical protein
MDGTNFAVDIETIVIVVVKAENFLDVPTFRRGVPDGEVLGAFVDMDIL